MKTWEVEIQEAEPELFIPLPDEVSEELNLKVGDSLKWEDVYGDGSKFVLTKVEKYTPEEKKVIEQAKSKLREIEFLHKLRKLESDRETVEEIVIQISRAETDTIFFEVAKIMLKELYE